MRDRFIKAGVVDAGVIAPGRDLKPEILAETVEGIVQESVHAVQDDDPLG